MLLPVALAPPLRRSVRALDRPRQLLLGGMLALALLGQLALGTHSFPFIAWDMYARGAPIARGIVTTHEFDAVLRSGRRIALAPADHLGPESADRISETLRRQVVRLKAASGARKRFLRAEHEGALRALVSLYASDQRADPISGVLVLERQISHASGTESAPRLLWRVALR